MIHTDSIKHRRVKLLGIFTAARRRFTMIDISFMQLNATHPADFVYGVKSDYWLLLFVKTPALFHLPTGDAVCHPYSAILYPPNTFAYYQAHEGPYINDYVRFYADKDFSIDDGVPTETLVQISHPDSMEKLFELLSAEDYFKSDYSQMSISMLIRMMLWKMAESVSESDLTEQQRALIELRYEIKLKPNYHWTVDIMANKLHLSAGYLQNIYKKQFGVSCMQDVVNMRVELAKDYLAATDFNSRKIAGLCGYLNVEHFCRQFKAVTGLSPLAFRKSSVEPDQKQI